MRARLGRQAARTAGNAGTMGLGDTAGYRSVRHSCGQRWRSGPGVVGVPLSGSEPPDSSLGAGQDRAITPAGQALGGPARNLLEVCPTLL